MEASQLLKELKDDGWYLGDTEGPCRQYIHRQHSGLMTVCVRFTDELGAGTLQSAKEAAGRESIPRGELHPDRGPDIRAEVTNTGASAWSAAFPGCIATGKDESEARQRLESALSLHRKGLEEGST